MVYLNVLWPAMVYLNVPWPSMVYVNVPWPAMVYVNVPWPAMVYLNVPWPAMHMVYEICTMKFSFDLRWFMVHIHVFVFQIQTM